MTDVNDAAWNFAMDLFNVLCKAHPNENVFLSPLSILAALSMTLAGARGGTKEELEKALHLKSVASPDQLHQKVGALLGEVSKGGSTSLANRLYVQKDFNLLTEFKAILAKSYAAELGQVDFVRAAEAATAEINAWVEKNTSGRIKDLISKGALDDSTRLVIVNAIYFKGMWKKPFLKDETRDLTFHVAPGKEIPMAMMSKSDCPLDYNYSKELKSHCVKLAFMGDNLSFYVIVPEERFGLAAVEKALSAKPAHLRQLISNCTETDVQLLLLPRFSIASQFGLEEQLPQLGVKSLFSPTNCDLSGLASDSNLRISKVLHKALLEVTEEGAEAAAASAVEAIVCCLRYDLPTVVADHPFLVVLAHRGVPSFIGRVATPTAI